jgi:phage terminase small subunit
MAKKKSSKSGPSPVLRRQDETAHGNQWVSNPKQELFVRFYMDPTSQTFGNAYQSGLAAGYTDSYSKVIANPTIANKWVKEYHDLIQLEPEHIVAAIQKEAMNTYSNRGAERLKALEMLAKMKGMLVERTVVGHVNIEQALTDLK